MLLAEQARDFNSAQTNGCSLLLILDLLTYCLAEPFSLLSKAHLTTLERIQTLCAKIIVPRFESYHKRLDSFYRSPSQLLLVKVYIVNFFNKICSNIQP